MKQSSFNVGHDATGRTYTKLVGTDTSTDKQVIYVMTSLRYDDDKSKTYGEGVSLTIDEARRLMKSLNQIIYGNKH